jgi:hypothetical protein
MAASTSQSFFILFAGAASAAKRIINQRRAHASPHSKISFRQFMLLILIMLLIL